MFTYVQVGTLRVDVIFRIASTLWVLVNVGFQDLHLGRYCHGVKAIHYSSFRVHRRVVGHGSLPRFAFSFPRSNCVPIFRVVTRGSSRFPRELSFYDRLRVVLTRDVGYRVSGLPSYYLRRKGFLLYQLKGYGLLFQGFVYGVEGVSHVVPRALGVASHIRRF